MPQVSAVSGYHNHIGATGIQGGLPRKDIEKMIQTPEGAALVKMWMQRFILPENRSSAHSRTPSPVTVKSEPLDDHYDEPLDEPMELTTKRASSPESYESPLRCIQNMSIGSVSPGDQSPRSTEDLDEERQPKVNSHGKVKLNKCRQCKFVASSKTVYWEHIIQHMNPDKILRCPSCPFVTEYKHHLEYHLNNHNGAKPYKCDQCDYSCVNKSMLNSHLKSHSQVYQYRCNDCHYVAKYCHSFKMHLRKYNHTPSVVLNPDGTENPQQIIDVYGTRRGPKQKQMKQVNSVISPPQEHLPPRPNLPLAYNPFMFNHFMLPHLLGMFPAPFPAGMPLNLNIQESAQQHFEHNNSFNSPQKRNDSLSPIRNDSDSESTDEETVKNDNLQNNNNVLSCPHCGISFINKDMYVFHMSFHDSQNPLKCHKCSIICKDSVDFFRHLTAVPH